jgi:hypothetical protein
MSGKGHYSGGGTIIGPRARWSDHAEFPQGEQPPKDKSKQKPKQVRPGGKATPNHGKRPLTEEAQRRLQLQRILVAQKGAQLAKLQRELESERDQLRDLLVRYGLPTHELDDTP